jgi:hypothetical protein
MRLLSASRRVTVILVAAGVAFFTATTAHSADWDATARQCAEEIDAKVGCGSCGGLWPSWAECAVKRFYHGRIPQARVRQCIQEIAAKRAREHACNACGDPVDDVRSCVSGRP